MGGTILAVLLGGCGGAGAPATGERCAAGARAEELRAQLRHDRHTIHDLENEVALLRARLHDSPMALPGPVATGREVASSAPAADASAGPRDGSVTGEPLPESFGGSVFGGEVEIVYEGEAARPTKPLRIELHETSRTSQGLVPGDGDPAEDAAAPPVVTDLGPERLPVMSGRIPTVEEQLRRAPAAPIPGVDGGAGANAAVRTAVNPPAAPGLTEVPAAAPPLATQSDPIAEYRSTVAALRRGRHEYAVIGLRAFLERFPRHYLADNVQYFLAESYYQRKLHSVALAEFNKIVARYWRSNKLPDAMLKIGLCHLALGHRQAGRAALHRLVVRFPRTPPAKLARARLEELKRR